MLDIIAHVLTHQGLSSCRIDGSVTGRDRQDIIDSFNSASALSPDICLLTTKACGVGINLTGADRVIIFDPSWNPAEDRQAVDRAYRIGQQRDVVVYRLIMASSLEEKMYEKQVFKDGVRVVTEQGQSLRYFSSNETKELFRLGPDRSSEVMSRLWGKAGEELKEFDCASTELPGVLGFTRHDTLYEEKSAMPSHTSGKLISKTRPDLPIKLSVNPRKSDKVLLAGQQPISAWLSSADDFKIPKKKKNVDSNVVIDLTSPQHIDTSIDSSPLPDEKREISRSDQEAPTPQDLNFIDIATEISPISPEVFDSSHHSTRSDVGGQLNLEFYEVDESPSVALDMTAFIVDSPSSENASSVKSPIPPIRMTSTSALNSFDLSLELVSLRNIQEEVDASALNLTDFLSGGCRTAALAPCGDDLDADESKAEDLAQSAEANYSCSSTKDHAGSDSEAEWDEAFGTKGTSLETRSLMIDPSSKSLFPRTDRPYDAKLVSLPRHKLSVADIEVYNRHITLAVSKTRTGDTIGYTQGLIAALHVCDDSINLHKALFALFQRDN